MVHLHINKINTNTEQLPKIINIHHNQIQFLAIMVKIIFMDVTRFKQLRRNCKM